MLTLAEVASYARGRLVDAGVADAGRVDVTDVSTDSRRIGRGALFVALTGERFDGHAFLADVAGRGAAAALVSREPDEAPALPLVVVDDTRRALGDLAGGWRRRFALPLVAVTGSNGKTTTKEMIAAILAAAYGEADRCATAGNLNNDVGVPLTLLRLRAHHRAAVVELGMNHPGETAALARAAGPTVALVLNAQREHQEFMATVDAVADEHALAIAALPVDGVAVFPADDPYAGVWRRAAGTRRVVDFACADAAHDGPHDGPEHDARPVAVRGRGTADGGSTRLVLSTPDGERIVRLATVGSHNLHNATAAAAACLAAGVALDAVVRGLEAFRPVAGRSHVAALSSGAIVIDDSYNANPDSMRAAIDLVAGYAMPRLLIAGDMGEVGAAGPRFHREVGDYARRRGVDALYALGDASRDTVDAFGAGARHFDDVDTLIAAVGDWLAHAASAPVVLVKGSRSMRMERVVAAVRGDAAVAGAH